MERILDHAWRSPTLLPSTRALNSGQTEANAMAPT